VVEITHPHSPSLHNVHSASKLSEDPNGVAFDKNKPQGCIYSCTQLGKWICKKLIATTSSFLQIRTHLRLLHFLQGSTLRSFSAQVGFHSTDQHLSSLRRMDHTFLATLPSNAPNQIEKDSDSSTIPLSSSPFLHY